MNKNTEFRTKFLETIDDEEIQELIKEKGHKPFNEFQEKYYSYQKQEFDKDQQFISNKSFNPVSS